MDYKIELKTGDWSNDGHGKTDNYFIESNLNWIELSNAYRKGTEIIGFDFCERVATGYEDHSIKKEYVDALGEHGYDISNFLDWQGNMEYRVDEEKFYDIYLFICGLGNPEFQWQDFRFNGTINIGGYGLMY